ncbi:MAG: hypothetical protein HY084_08180 [Gemmatimonadetes bacterium]|nr:hypothetical protein [Gemmatimonadota bacterium]
MLRSTMRALLVLACAGSVAQAQLGGLIKRAIEKKVEKKAVPEETQGPPLAGDPVDASTLDALLKGLSAEMDARAATAAKHDVLLAKQDEWRAADNASRPESDKWHAANSKIMDCVERSLRKSEEAFQEAAAQKMSNLGGDAKSQEFIKQYVALSQQLAQAVQKKDTAAVRRLTRQVGTLMGSDPAADSAAAYKVCGKPPAQTPAMIRTAKLRAEADSLQEEFRKAESGGADRAVAASGMPKEKYFVARERLLTWNSQRVANEGMRSVTKDEDALFKSRLAEIKKVEAALR